MELSNSQHLLDPKTDFLRGKAAFYRAQSILELLDSLNRSGNALPPQLLLVTKGISAEQIKGFLQGAKKYPRFPKLLFGENRIEELESKQSELAIKGYEDLLWAFIGKIQSRKMERILKQCCCILSVDSNKRLMAIDACLAKLQKRCDVYLQVNVSAQPLRCGILPDSFDDEKTLQTLLEEINSLQYGKFTGLMAMASKPDDQYPHRNYHEFLKMQRIRLILTKSLGLPIHGLELSIGMSSDFLLAILCGGSLVRLGTSIWHSPEA